MSESENNLLDKLRYEQVDKEYGEIFTAMKSFLGKVLDGAVRVLKATMAKNENKAILFITMEDTEINGYPVKFLLGLEKYENKSIETWGKTGLATIQDYMKNLDKRINTSTRKIEEYIVIEIDWDENSEKPENPTTSDTSSSEIKK